jgi:hypothetical protein
MGQFGFFDYEIGDFVGVAVQTVAFVGVVLE